MLMWGLPSLDVPVTPDVIPQQLIAVSNVHLVTSYGCNSLMPLNLQRSIAATSAISVLAHQCRHSCTVNALMCTIKYSQNPAINNCCVNIRNAAA